MKNVLSLFDYSGHWSEPWGQSHHVYTHDLKVPETKYLFRERIHIAGDILEWNPPDVKFDVVLAAVPCTNFALSGTRWFASKDADGRTADSLKLVAKTLEIIQLYKPRVWAIENPMFRIHKLVPELGQPRFKFHPWQFGGYGFPDENYYKQTWLWGNFKVPIVRPVPPEARDKNGHGRIGNAWKLPKNERAEVRSITPKGFARGFYEANKGV